MFWSWRWLISFNLSNWQGRLSSSGADEIALVRASGGLFFFFFFYYVTHLATGWKVCVQHSTHGFRQEYLENWRGRRWQRLKWKKSARWEVSLKSTEQLNGRKKKRRDTPRDNQWRDIRRSSQLSSEMDSIKITAAFTFLPVYAMVAMGIQLPVVDKLSAAGL